MHVLVTGATGFLGTALCRVLHDAGHRLTVLSRDPQGARRHLPMVEKCLAWTPMRAPAPEEAFVGVEGVVHLAGERVAGIWTSEKRKRIRESRVVGTRNLVWTLAHLTHKPRILVSGSAIGFYGDRGDEILTEAAQAGSDFLAHVCRAWEREASTAQTCGVDVALLRTGIVLGDGGGALLPMLPLFKMGLGGPLGSGRQWWSWIHREDLIRLICHMLDKGLKGPVNGTAPSPVRQREFAHALGSALRRPAVLPAPAWGVKSILGGFAAELLSSRRVVPKEARESGFRFTYPELGPALNAVLTDGR